MRFLQSEYKPVIAAIQSAGWTEGDFAFVKKRGKVNINHLATGSTFQFFRKTETILNEEKKWEKAVSYKLGMEKAALIEAKHWDEVLCEFKKWLKGLNK